MKLVKLISVLICMYAIVVNAEPYMIRKHMLGQNIAKVVSSDFSHMYTWQNLLIVGGAVGIAGVFANTNLDNYLHKTLPSTPHDVNITMRHMVLPLIGFGITVDVIERFISSTTVLHPVAIVAEHSLRSYLVGFPLVITLSPLLGSTKASIGNPISTWHAFRGKQGVNRDLFFETVPLFVAFNEFSNTYVKIGSLTGVALLSYGEMSDELYPSASLIALSMAFLSAYIINKSDNTLWSVHPAVLPGNGFGLTFHWQNAH